MIMPGRKTTPRKTASEPIILTETKNPASNIPSTTPSTGRPTIAVSPSSLLDLDLFTLFAPTKSSFSVDGKTPNSVTSLGSNATWDDSGSFRFLEPPSCGSEFRQWPFFMVKSSLILKLLFFSSCQVSSVDGKTLDKIIFSFLQAWVPDEQLKD